MFLNQLLHKNGILSYDIDWWKLSDEELNTLIINQTNLLLRYHLQEMKVSLRGNKDAAKAFFTKHNKHLYWQIYRIYRYRNKLIHEAAILPGLDNVIRCQRFYLVLLLNQMIRYFSETDVRPLSMDCFFYEYAQKNNLLNNIVKQDLQGDQRISLLMEIGVFNELIRQNA